MRISGNLKDPFVPYPTYSYPFLRSHPFPPPRICTAAGFLFSDADASRETSHEIFSIILVHALALWPRYESLRERSELFGFAFYVFLTSVPVFVYYPGSLTWSQQVSSRSKSVKLALYQSVWKFKNCLH